MGIRTFFWHWKPSLAIEDQVPSFLCEVAIVYQVTHGPEYSNVLTVQPKSSLWLPSTISNLKKFNNLVPLANARTRSVPSPSLCIDIDSISAVYISESFPMTCIEIISTTTTQGHKHALFDEVD